MIRAPPPYFTITNQLGGAKYVPHKKLQKPQSQKKRISHTERDDHYIIYQLVASGIQDFLFHMEMYWSTKHIALWIAESG